MVRVLGPDGDDLGVMPISEAIRLAAQLGLDVVTVDDEAEPPVVRIVDFGKLVYERDAGRRKVLRDARHILREVVADQRRTAALAKPQPQKWEQRRADREKR